MCSTHSRERKRLYKKRDVKYAGLLQREERLRTTTKPHLVTLSKAGVGLKDKKKEKMVEASGREFDRGRTSYRFVRNASTPSKRGATGIKSFFFPAGKRKK